MKRVIIITNILLLLAACAKKDEWETNKDKYMQEYRMCHATAVGAEADPRVPLPEECFKFNKYYKKKEGKSVHYLYDK